MPANESIVASTPTGELMIPQTIGTAAPEVPAETPTALTPEQERIAQLEANLAASQSQINQLLQIAMRPQQAAQPAAPQAPAEFDLDGLPDPVSAPTDFTKQLTAKIRQRDAQRDASLTHNITTQVARGAAMDSLYNRFSQQHTDLAKKGALLQGAAGIEFQNLRNQGIDPIALAQQNPDSLIGMIAARMNTELGVAVTPGAPMSTARVAGIQGGSQGVAKAAPTAPATRGFSDQIKDAQKKMGLL